MQIFLNDVIDSPTLEAICRLLDQSELFQPGSHTAAGMAKQVKNNEQIVGGSAESRGALRRIEQALMAHPVFQAAAIPKQCARLMFSKYTEGMQYGVHSDNAFMDGIRADLSFTLFLSEAESYDGGELVLHHHHGDDVVKLSKGELVLYPSTSLHEVAAVTRGTRLAIVGWVESRVRSAEQREILFDLHLAKSQLPDTPENRPAKQQLVKAHANLLRQWA